MTDTYHYKLSCRGCRTTNVYPLFNLNFFTFSPLDTVYSGNIFREIYMYISKQLSPLDILYSKL